MRKQGKIILLLVAIVALVVSYAFFTRDEEPSYQGRSLSYWLVELGHARIGVHPAQPQMAERPMTAISSMGTNSMPFLIQYSRYTIPAWRVQWVNTRAAVGRWFGRKWNQMDADVVRNYYRAVGAIEAFAILGPEAEAAIPDLARFAEDLTHRDRASSATLALGSLGPKAVTPLLRALTNENVPLRYEAAVSLTRLGTNARPAVPALLTILNNPGAQTRVEVTNALRAIAPEVLTNAPPR